MDLQEIIEKVKQEPELLTKLTNAFKDGKVEEFLKEHDIKADTASLEEMIKKVTGESGDVLDAIKKIGGDDLKKATGEGSNVVDEIKNVAEKGEFKEILEKGEALLGNLFGGEKK